MFSAHQHWSGEPICRAKDKNDAQARVDSCTLQETVHVYPESIVTSSNSVEQELRGAGACDTCCNCTVAAEEWMHDNVHSLKKLKLKYWTLLCQERFKFGAGDPLFARRPSSFHTWSLCNHACFRGARKTDPVGLVKTR